MSGKTDDFHSQVKQLGIVTSIPVILLVGPVVGYFIGGWIDRKAHIHPWFTAIFVCLGFIAASREVFRLLKQLSRDDARRPDKKDP